MAILSNRLYLAVTLGHFAIDISASMGPVLVTFLSVSLALSAAQIGLAIGLYQLISAGSQPLFGWLTDKVGSRWLGPGSVIWAAGFLALAVFAAQTTQDFLLFLVFFSLAAVGVGAFHPLGTMHAGTSVAGKAATAMAIFFLFGQTGLASGPAVGGLVLDQVGPAGLYGLPILTIPLLIFMAYAMRHTVVKSTAAAKNAGQEAKTATKESVRWAAIGLLALMAALRSWAFLGTVSFLPKIFQDMGWDATGYGLITGAFWMASAIAGVVGGHLADRWGRRQVVFVTVLAGSIPLYFLPLNDGWQAFVLAFMCGGLLGASHSIIVVIAQSLVPGRKAFASGATLGFIFGVGALAAWCIGILADSWGLTVVIQAGAAVGISAALLALFLPATKETGQLQPAAIPPTPPANQTLN
jgi:FSR family fosmidomycin resistance protein-like MFS transporter